MGMYFRDRSIGEAFHYGWVFFFKVVDVLDAAVWLLYDKGISNLRHKETSQDRQRYLLILLGTRHIGSCRFWVLTNHRYRWCVALEGMDYRLYRPPTQEP